MSVYNTTVEPLDSENEKVQVDGTVKIDTYLGTHYVPCSPLLSHPRIAPAEKRRRPGQTLLSFSVSQYNWDQYLYHLVLTRNRWYHRAEEGTFL